MISKIWVFKVFVFFVLFEFKVILTNTQMCACFLQINGSKLSDASIILKEIFGKVWNSFISVWGSHVCLMKIVDSEFYSPNMSFLMRYDWLTISSMVTVFFWTNNLGGTIFMSTVFTSSLDLSCDYKFSFRESQALYMYYCTGLLQMDLT